jgi:hypothetical protein
MGKFEPLISERITMHCFAAEIGSLIAAANKVYEITQDLNSSALSVLQRQRK